MEEEVKIQEETPMDEALERYEEPVAEPKRYGRLKCKCACGNVSNMTDDVIEEGISWTLIIGNDHYLTMHCEECGSEMTMFLEEIQKREEDELPKESNEE